jgi:tetratricopeptide (TPR) repeat protein
MTQRKSVRGPRSSVLWLVIILVLALAIALAVILVIIGPQQQLRQQVQATAEARQAEVERLYQAGVAFQDAGDCSKAAKALAQVISKEPGYKDAQSRLAEARACQQAAEATATADARSSAQAAAATATVEAAAAIEAAYQRGLGYYNLERWAEAQAAFGEVFALDPTYKDVQTKLAEVEAKLAEVRRLTPTATPRPTDTPVPLTPVLAIAAMGQPSYSMGKDLGYFIWQDHGREWHVRWNGDGSHHYFSGVIRVGPSSKIGTVETYSFDKATTELPRDMMSHTEDYILFNAFASDGDDGLDFSTSGPGAVSFDLVLDGAYEPLRVYIGERRTNPNAIPFTLQSE